MATQKKTTTKRSGGKRSARSKPARPRAPTPRTGKAIPVRQKGEAIQGKARAHRTGRLLLIGGGEERTAEGEILRHFVKIAGGSRARILVCGAALDHSAETLAEYRRVFERLGATVETEQIEDRLEGDSESLLGRLEKSNAVFLTGGDQLQLTSTIAGTAFGEMIRTRVQENRILVAGTSAGSAALSGTMIVGGSDSGTVRRADVELAPGLGYWRDAIVDTHFNQRGRVHRLLTVFAENPQILGIGLDQNTAIDLDMGRGFVVLGEGAVIVFDGRVTHTNVADIDSDEVIAMTDSFTHVLPRGYGFDLRKMRPTRPSKAS